jgi:hypothetical protein
MKASLDKKIKPPKNEYDENKLSPYPYDVFRLSLKLIKGGELNNISVQFEAQKKESKAEFIELSEPHE